MQPANILFIIADQLVYDALGCTGSPVAITPNLDALAARGVVCDAAYSNSPVCTPYRASLMTGRHASAINAMHNEAPLPAGVPTLAEVLGGAGYTTSYVGKWHLGATGNVAVHPDMRGGFHEFVGYQACNDYLNRVIFYDEQQVPRRFSGNRTQATSTLAMERLERLAGSGRPWALVVSYQDPHYPLQPEPGYAALFHGRDMPLVPGQVDTVEPHTPTWSPLSPRPVQRDPVWQRYGGDLREYLRLYQAQVCQLDAEVGRLLAELRALGEEERTLVVFTCDHGEMQGRHGLVNKCFWHEPSARVPVIVAGPGVPAETRCAVPFGCVEWLATCCDWAGTPCPDGVHGTSLRGVFEGRSAEHHPVFSECAKWIAIRRGPWKLAVERADLRILALHQVVDDPHELVDRRDDPTVAGMRAELLALLTEARAGRFPGIPQATAAR